jgi:hypothetical protein
MNMKRNTLALLAAAMVPTAGFADEKPLWEMVTRLDGTEENSRLQQWVKEVFSSVDSTGVLGAQAVFRVAGFENAATPGEDWVAEIGGLADADGLLKRLGEAVEADAQGRYVIEEEGLSFVVWRDGESGLRFAGPPVNAGVSVTPVVRLQHGESISGWVDLKRLGQEALESKSLKLPESLGFSASIAGDGISLELVAEMATAEMVGTTRKLLGELHAELAAGKSEAAEKLPAFVISSEGNRLTVKVTMSGEELDRFIGEATKVIGEP